MQEKRKKRFEELIQREIGNALLINIRHPLFTKVTITRVSIASNLSSAKIFFSVFDYNEIDSITKLLKDETKFLRKILATKVNLRLTPKINFVYDESIRRSCEILDLINSVSTKK